MIYRNKDSIYFNYSNIVSENEIYGLLFLKSHNVSLMNNSINYNRYEGICFDNSSIDIINNTINENGHHGIVCFESGYISYVRIISNTIVHNLYDGIRLVQDNLEVEIINNNISHNEYYGIHVSTPVSYTHLPSPRDRS